MKNERPRIRAEVPGVPTRRSAVSVIRPRVRIQAGREG